jgi:Ca2+-binding EF-hand superfamily protein
MRSLQKGLTAAALCAAMISAPAVFAQKGMGDTMDADHFVKMCDADKDGMVSKAEMMKMIEKTWDKADKSKTGKLDKAQVEFFLKELMKGGG